MKKENRVGICMGFVWELYGLFWDLCGVLLLIFQIEKCYSVGMRKEASETIGKTTDYTFVDLYPPSTIPFTTLYPPFLYHVFGKGCGIKKQSGKGRCENDYRSYLLLTFTLPFSDLNLTFIYPLPTPILRR